MDLMEATKVVHNLWGEQCSITDPMEVIRAALKLLGEQLSSTVVMEVIRAVHNQTDIMNFAKNLIKARNNLGISQVELAKRLCIGQSAIANYEAGIRNPSLKELEKIAKALNTTAARLIE